MPDYTDPPCRFVFIFCAASLFVCVSTSMRSSSETRNVFTVRTVVEGGHDHVGPKGHRAEKHVSKNEPLLQGRIQSYLSLSIDHPHLAFPASSRLPLLPTLVSTLTSIICPSFHPCRSHLFHGSYIRLILILPHHVPQLLFSCHSLPYPSKAPTTEPRSMPQLMTQRRDARAGRVRP